MTMLGKLKDLFGPNRPSAGKSRPSRVNLQRRFTLVSLTAQGSMSRVHRAVDNKTGRTVCLKVQIPDKNAAAAARSAQESRPPEGEIGVKIVHPHVVRTFEHGESTKGEHFVVMEFIDGVSLHYLRESHSTNLAEKIELLAQAAEGLAAVHAHGYIHHDIGPKNFLVDRERQVKLIDFGLAVPNTPAFRRPGNRTGTLQYMAPELVRREPTDERLDIFSFGAMAYELLTDRLPYDSSAANSMTMMLQRINQEPLDPLRADPTLPPELGELIRKLIARRKEDRLPSMTHVAEALRAIPVKTKSRA
jgi:eukaryotic-like serine/threonine-protein kinase